MPDFRILKGSDNLKYSSKSDDTEGAFCGMCYTTLLFIPTASNDALKDIVKLLMRSMANISKLNGYYKDNNERSQLDRPEGLLEFDSVVALKPFYHLTESDERLVAAKESAPGKAAP